MKHTALLLTMLATLPLGACAMAPLEGESEGQASSTTEPLWTYVANPIPTLIDFDSDPGGVAIADGTIVDQTYAVWGVTFTCMVCSSGHAFARKPGWSGNGVSLVASPVVPAFDARLGAVRAEFRSPRSWVSVDVLPLMAPEFKGTPTARPWLQAFDAAENLIGPAYYPAYGTPGWGQGQTLRIDDPNASIKSVRLSSQHGSPQVFATFDNLRINTDPYWTDVPLIQRPIFSKPEFIRSP